MTRSLLALGLVGCFPSLPPTDTGIAGTADTGSADTGSTGSADTGSADTGSDTGAGETAETSDTGGTGDTGTGSTGTHGGVGEITAVWYLAEFGIDGAGDLATVQTAEGPISPRLRAVFMNGSWGQDFDDIANYCVITFDTVATVAPDWVVSDPDAWFGIEFDPSHHTSNCAPEWGDVYGTYLAGWTGAWGISVGGDEVHFTTDLPGYGSQFGAEEPWVFDARGMYSTDGILADVVLPDIDFWAYAYAVDAAMSPVLDGAGERVPMLDADVHLDPGLASGWYEVTGSWLYGIDAP